MPLDPQSYNPADVEAELLRYVTLLEQATQECRKRGIASARADAEFRTAWAIATLAADEQATNDGKKLTVATREALAVRATGPEFLAKREAEEVLHAARSASSNLREMVGALRTIATNLRELVRS